MTGYERLLTAAELRQPDRVPVFPLIMTFAGKMFSVPYSEYCTKASVQAEIQVALARHFGLDAVHPSSDACREVSALGADCEYPYDDLPVNHGVLVTSGTDLERLEQPNPLGDNLMHEQVKAVRLMKDALAGEVAVFGWVEGPLAMAGMLAGVDGALLAVAADPTLATGLLEFSLEMETRFALAQIDAGADLVAVGDSIASLLSARHYEAYALPYAARLIGRIHATGCQVKYHICGNTSHLVDLVWRTGADIINFDSAVDLAYVKATIGDKTCIKGNLHPVQVLLQGNRETVRQAVKRCIDQAAAGGGYILSPGCEVPTNTPPENLEALVEAGIEFGRYDT